MIEPSLNTWTIFFLIAAVQGLFLATMIFLRRSKANNLLGSLILAFSLCMLYYVSFWTNYVSVLPSFIALAQGLTYAMGPLLYFYIRSSKKKVYFNWYHFIPLALFVFVFVGWSWYPKSWWTPIISGQLAVQTVHIAVYTLLIFHYIRTHKGFSNGELKLYQWRRKLLWAFLGYSLSFAAYSILVWTGALKVEYDYMISVMSTFFIYFIGYHGFQRQEVFKQYENGRYVNSGLTSTASMAVLVSLRSYMTQEKPFLESSLRLQDLAARLHLSQHYISQAINDQDGKNFADFINEYRIEEAKKLLSESDQKKIIHVAYDTGFNNKASFNNAFKRFTGMSPSEFREHQFSVV